MRIFLPSVSIYSPDTRRLFQEWSIKTPGNKIDPTFLRNTSIVSLQELHLEGSFFFSKSLFSYLSLSSSCKSTRLRTYCQIIYFYFYIMFLKNIIQAYHFFCMWRCIVALSSCTISIICRFHTSFFFACFCKSGGFNWFKAIHLRKEKDVSVISVLHLLIYELETSIRIYIA